LIKINPLAVAYAILKFDLGKSVMAAKHLKLIRLEVARSKAFPQGSARHGHEFVAPLRADGHIDTDEWKSSRESCWVKRFWAGDEEQTGKLVHKPGGSEHARWLFAYDEAGDEDDKAGYRFGAHAFIPGEYVSIRDDKDEMHTFSVASVESLQ
jgi:hypothetical protein